MTKQGWVELIAISIGAFAATYAETSDWRKALGAAIAAILLKRAAPRAQVPLPTGQLALPQATQPAASAVSPPPGLDAAEPATLAERIAQTEGGND